MTRVWGAGRGQGALSRCQLRHLSPESFLRVCQVDGVAVARAAGDSCGPVDLEEVPLWILEVAFDGAVQQFALTFDLVHQRQPLVHEAQ